MNINIDIRNDFKYKRYSNLDFLSDENLWESENCNIGCYYFLLERKNIDNSHVFKRILEIYKNEASAYNYLGDVSTKLFLGDHSNISSYFYEKAMYCDENETDYVWKLYGVTNDCMYFYTALTKDYRDEKFEQISQRLKYLYTPPLVKSDYSIDIWKEIRLILSNVNIKNCSDILIICSYFIGDFESGKLLIDKAEHTNHEIIELYYNSGHIDLDFALDNISYLFANKLSGCDSYRYYKLLKKESEKGQANPTNAMLAKYSFEAGEYLDSIKYSSNEIKSGHSIDNFIEFKLYHEISSSLLGKPIDESYVTDMLSYNFYYSVEKDQDNHIKPLYLIFLVIRNLDKLERTLLKGRDIVNISHYTFYIEIEKYMSESSVVEHYLYETIFKKTQNLKQAWDHHINTNIVNRLTPELDILNDNDRIQLASSLMSLGEFDKSISILETLTRSMTVCNLMGVCFERKKLLKEALPFYEEALNLMISSNEEDDVIITNYLSIIKKLNLDISTKKYNKLISIFNKSLANNFEYDRFLTDNYYSLFKYYPFNKNTLDALTNSYFYLASSELLNDPIELPYDSLNSNDFHFLIDPKFRLSSFSNNKNSMLMWSHYTENHTGLMIEYCFEGGLPDGVGMNKVSYSNVSNRFKNKDNYIFNQYMLTKNEDWSYEKEVRLFAYDKEKLYYDIIKYPSIVSDKINAYIVSITLGFKFPDSMIKLVSSIISELNKNRPKNLPEIKLKKAKLSDSNCFSLEYEDIS